jgi:Ca2+-binding RTX toxin-like protein
MGGSHPLPYDGGANRVGERVVSPSCYRKGLKMGKSTLLMVSMALALLLASGAAWAATVNCTPGAFRCTGETDGPDTIYGTEGPDAIDAKDGSDKVYGRGGDDLRDVESGGGLGGGDGKDVVRGGEGSDDVYGGRGSDRVFGGPGDDYVTGETANYFIGGEAPGNYISGGPGDDTIRAQDRYVDRIYCGLGHDTVTADNVKDTRPSGRDYVDDSCERVDRY